MAEYLHHVKMVEKLDDRDDRGAPGQWALDRRLLRPCANWGMHRRRCPQRRLPAPKPVYVPAPPPSSIEQAKIIDEAREYVMNYTKNLPNFICVQVTRRSFDPKGGNNWYNGDTITTASHL